MSFTTPNNWKTLKLHQITEPSRKQWKVGDGVFDYIGLEHINQNDLSLNGKGTSETLESNKFVFKKGDVLFGKLRPYFRKVVRINFDGVCSTDIWVFRAKEGIDQGFLFYFLANQRFVDAASGGSSGTRMPRADWDYLKNTEWSIPPLEEQRSIAAMLGSLDDKIELLRAQNKTLEAMAQTLFKEWFVDFRFPSSTGVMVDSELGEIPEGWRVGKLGELFKITMGQSPAGESYNENADGMIFYQGRTDFGERFPSVRLYTTEPKRTAEKFDVLVSVRAPVGDINQAVEPCCLGRGVAGVSSDLKSFCFYMMKNKQSDIQKFEAGGTVFGSINKDDFQNIQVIIPPSMLQVTFEETIRSTDQKIFNNFLKINTLTNLRNQLLLNIFPS